MEFVSFSDNQKDLAKDLCKSLIMRCDNYMQLHPNSRIWLRDTDHRYCSIRLETANTPEEDVEELCSQCARCGSNIHLEHGNEYYDDYDLNFCMYCNALTNGKGLEQVGKLLAYLDRNDGVGKAESNKSKIGSLLSPLHRIIRPTKKVIPNLQSLYNLADAEKYKIRVLTKSHDLLYLKLDRIRMDKDGNLEIRGLNKTDKVQFAGVYLRVKDKNGKRLYQGDIVKAHYKNYDGGFCSFIGVATLRYSQPISEQFPFLIETDLYGNLPPHPNSVDYDSVELLGNLFETPGIICNGSEDNVDKWIHHILR